MKSVIFFSALLSGALLLGMRPASDKDESVLAHEIVGTMQVEGTKQGMIPGRPGTGAGNNRLNLTSFKMGSEAPLDPRSSPVKGAKTHHLIVVTKEIDEASPKLFQAFNENEVLKSVVIRLTKKTPDGKQMVARTVTLTDVLISKIRQAGPDLSPLHLEELSYAYRLILIENADGSTSTTDDVTANNQ